MIRSDVMDALEAAAGAGDEEISSMRCMERGDMRSTPSKRRITGARMVVKMFLDGLPADMTVGEILSQIED